MALACEVHIGRTRPRGPHLGAREATAPASPPTTRTITKAPVSLTEGAEQYGLRTNNDGVGVELGRHDLWSVMEIGIRDAVKKVAKVERANKVGGSTEPCGEDDRSATYLEGTPQQKRRGSPGNAPLTPQGKINPGIFPHGPFFYHGPGGSRMN